MSKIVRFSQKKKSHRRDSVDFIPTVKRGDKGIERGNGFLFLLVLCQAVQVRKEKDMDFFLPEISSCYGKAHHPECFIIFIGVIYKWSLSTLLTSITTGTGTIYNIEHRKIQCNIALCGYQQILHFSYSNQVYLILQQATKIPFLTETRVYTWKIGNSF